MQNSILWMAFSRKIEDNLKFLHLRRFTKFLLSQNYLLLRSRKQAKLSLFNPQHPMDPIRKELTKTSFDNEYNTLLQVNSQNLKTLLANEKQKTLTAQEQVKMQ